MFRNKYVRKCNLINFDTALRPVKLALSQAIILNLLLKRYISKTKENKKIGYTPKCFAISVRKYDLVNFDTALRLKKKKL